MGNGELVALFSDKRGIFYSLGSNFFTPPGTMQLFYMDRFKSDLHPRIPSGVLGRLRDLLCKLESQSDEASPALDSGWTLA